MKVIDSRMPGVDAGIVDRSVDMKERQVRHLVRLVDDLLDLSRVMRGKIRLRPERLDLARAIERGVETARTPIDFLGHELAVRLAGGPFILEADPVRLAQVVGNLLTNAARDTGPKGLMDLDVRRVGREAVVVRKWASAPRCSPGSSGSSSRWITRLRGRRGDGESG